MTHRGPTPSIAASPDGTLHYYETHAGAYAESTRHLDVSPLRDQFLAQVRPGGMVIDAGCGSGRDAMAFKAAGFPVRAYDATPGLARIAASALGEPVTTCTHQTVSLEALRLATPADGLWASATLLHVPRTELPGVMARFATLLQPGAPAFVTFKVGNADGPDRVGRWFTYMTEDQLRALFQDRSTWDVPIIGTSTGGRRADTIWIHAIIHRAR